jgi:hypothetical protein
MTMAVSIVLMVHYSVILELNISSCYFWVAQKEIANGSCAKNFER